MANRKKRISGMGLGSAAAFSLPKLHRYLEMVITANSVSSRLLHCIITDRGGEIVAKQQVGQI